MNNIDFEKILNLEVVLYECPKTTIRKYLHKLLSMVWEERECFDGKRPFGNSGWENDLYYPLVKAGYVKGSLDKEGGLEDVDTHEGQRFVSDVIEYLFKEF